MPLKRGCLWVGREEGREGGKVSRSIYTQGWARAGSAVKRVRGVDVEKEGGRKGEALTCPRGETQLKFGLHRLGGKSGRVVVEGEAAAEEDEDDDAKSPDVNGLRGGREGGREGRVNWCR